MRKKRNKKFIITIVILFILVACPFIIDSYMKNSTGDYILKEEDLTEIGMDCILVLGAGLRPDGTPNLMLQDRLDKGIELYNMGIAPKILLSGDNGQEYYDEVNAMKIYTLSQGVPSEDIFLDHAGFSTYESLYRARDIFQVEKTVLITQQFHQYRALYIARGFGIEAYGVNSMTKEYVGQTKYETREFLARNKDFFKMMVKPEPTYLGDVIPITSSGFPSHD